MLVSQICVCNRKTQERQPHPVSPLLSLVGFLNATRPKRHLIKYINCTETCPVNTMYVWLFQYILLFDDLSLFIFRPTSDTGRSWRRQPRRMDKNHGLRVLVYACVYLVGLIVLHSGHYNFHVVSITSLFNNPFKLCLRKMSMSSLDVSYHKTSVL